MRIYLDHNATTPMPAVVRAAVLTALTEDFGNPSSLHYAGQRARATVDAARAAVASLIGAEPADLVFTSGGTEADNLALRGALDARATGATPRRRLIVSAIEHEAVLRTARALERAGWPLTVVPVDARGVVDPDDVAKALGPDVALVSVMHANNEIGTLQPVAEIAALARAAGAWCHVDAVQSAGKVAIDVTAWGRTGVDLVAISAHKFGGPKGIGALWIRRGVTLSATATGGRQERNRRAGTENVPGIAGMAAAASWAQARRSEADGVTALRDQLEVGVREAIAGAVVNGDGAPRLGNTSNISFDGVEAETLLMALDLEGIAVSTGAACSSGTLEPSHVLLAMGQPGRARSSVRFSLGTGTTSGEIDHVLAVLPPLVDKLRHLGRRKAAVR